MAKLRRSDAHKRQLMKLLREEGRPTYARLLNYFYVFITDDPDVIAYMRVDKAIIVLNQNLALDQVSTIVRHEIMHEFLTHALRRDKIHAEHPEYPFDQELFNIAADYEISNKMYTDNDKSVARGLYLGKDESNRDRILRGLVTEDDFPGWEHMTFEEMYYELQKMRQQDRERNKQQGDGDSQEGQSGESSGSGSSSNSDESSGDGDDENGSSDSGGEGTSSSTSDKNSSGTGNKPLDKLISRARQLNKQDSDEDIDEAIKELEEAQAELDKMDAELESGFEDSSEKAQRSELERTISDASAEIRKFLDDPSNFERMEREEKRARQKEKIAADERASESRRLNPLNKFKMDLNSFIAEQIREVEQRSMRKLNPAYEDSDFFIPGEADIDVEDIPVVNVYHDVSGSFNDEAKTSAAMQAVDSIQTYVNRGELVVNKFYFADRVSKTRSEAGGGTNGEAVLRHIKETKPTNVIIITDAGVYNCSTFVKVPGGVWILFYDGPSPNLIQKIKGARQTKTYQVYYRE